MSRYHYTKCGLDNVFVKNAEFERSGPEGRITQIPGLRVLHTLIAIGILLRDCAISNLELKFLRLEFGLTAEDWFKVLRSDAPSIADWELGKKKIPPLIELKIRDFILQKLFDRKEHFRAYGVDISGAVDRARIQCEELSDRASRRASKRTKSLVEDVPNRILRNCTDRVIEISHDGGGRYSIESD